MHNIRKIKRKKAKIVNPEQLAQQKLFEISRFQDEEERVSEVDLFIEKLKPRINKSESEIQTKSKLKPHSRTFADFYQHQYNKNQRKSEQLALLNELRNQSCEIIRKKPLELISYVLFDRRESIGQISLNKSRMESLAKIKKKMKMSKTKSLGPQKGQFDNVERIFDDKTDAFGNCSPSKKSEPPFQIKNIKLFTKYTGIMPTQA